MLTPSFLLPQLLPSVEAAGWGGLCALGACRSLTTAWHSRFPGINSREFYTAVYCHQMCLKGLADKLAVRSCILRIHPHTPSSWVWPVCGKK